MLPANQSTQYLKILKNYNKIFPLEISLQCWSVSAIIGIVPKSKN